MLVWHLMPGVQLGVWMSAGRVLTSRLSQRTCSVLPCLVKSSLLPAPTASRKSCPLSGPSVSGSGETVAWFGLAGAFEAHLVHPFALSSNLEPNRVAQFLPTFCLCGDVVLLQLDWVLFCPLMEQAHQVALTLLLTDPSPAGLGSCCPARGAGCQEVGTAALPAAGYLFCLLAEELQHTGFQKACQAVMWHSPCLRLRPAHPAPSFSSPQQLLCGQGEMGHSIEGLEPCLGHALLSWAGVVGDAGASSAAPRHASRYWQESRVPCLCQP